MATWPLWYDTTTVGSTTTTAGVWRGDWVNTTVATWGTSNNINGVSRASWVNGYLCLTQPPTSATIVTPESDQLAIIARSPSQAADLQRELARMAERAAIAQRRREREQRRTAREWEQSLRRANRLLLRHLDREQKAMYAAERRFLVHSANGQRRYEIIYGHAHNVFLLDEYGERDRELCVVLREPGCPVPDVMLAQLLWIQHQEEEMLSRANIWDVRTRQVVHHGTGPQVRAA